MRRTSVWSSLIAAVAFVVVTTVAIAGDVPPALLQKYEPAVEKLQGLYSHATVTGTVMREFPQKKERYEQRYVLRAAGPKSRLDINTSSSRNGGPPVGTVEVYLATPDASFYGTGLGEAPAIDTARELTYSEAKARIAAAFPIDKPFSMGSTGTVLELLSKSQVRVDAVQKIAHKGQQFVKISYDQPGGGKDSSGLAQSYVLLSPSEGWAIREFSNASAHGADQKVVRGKISYGDSHDGVPVVERIETWEYEGRQQTLVLHEVVQVSKFEAGNPAGKYFAADTFH